MDGPYFLKPTKTPFPVDCVTEGDDFVSLGGDGTTKERAAASCTAQKYIIGNTDTVKWIDPDGNADDTRNAQEVVCPDGKTKSKAAASCAEAKVAGGNSDDYYWVTYGGNPRRVWCDMNTDGGGWILVSTQSPNGGFYETQSITVHG